LGQTQTPLASSDIPSLHLSHESVSAFHLAGATQETHDPSNLTYGALAGQTHAKVSLSKIYVLGQQGIVLTVKVET